MNIIPGNTTTLIVSIVIYHPNIFHLEQTFKSLQGAIERILKNRTSFRTKVILVDNGTSDDQYNASFLKEFIKKFNLDIFLLSGHGNIGYGCGHNMAIERFSADYHLVLNPDVIIDDRTIEYGIDLLNKNKHIGLAVPLVEENNGGTGHLCKRYPDIFTLFLRAVNLKILNNAFENRLSHYEMRDIDLDDLSTNILIASGCFMLFKKAILKTVNGFDPKYFLYFEDFDLSLRLQRLCLIGLDPKMKIFHFGGNASLKGRKHIQYFLKSAIIFFNTHGWKFF